MGSIGSIKPQQVYSMEGNHKKDNDNKKNQQSGMYGRFERERNLNVENQENNEHESMKDLLLNQQVLLFCLIRLISH